MLILLLIEAGVLRRRAPTPCPSPAKCVGLKKGHSAGARGDWVAGRF